MYEEFDEVLTQNQLNDFWYDVDCIYADELLLKFTPEDWRKLNDSIKFKDNGWKIRLVYCIDQDSGMNGLEMLLSLLNEPDEVLEYVLDSLRFFESTEFRKKIQENELAVEQAKRLWMATESLPVKKVLERFLEDISE